MLGLAGSINSRGWSKIFHRRLLSRWRGGFAEKVPKETFKRSLKELPLN